MHFSTSKSAILALTAAQAVYAHTGFSNFYVDGVNQGDAVCVRMNPDPSTWNFPMPDVTGEEMACGMGGTTGVKRVCEVPDGAQMTFEFRQEADRPGGDVVDISHMGPCAVYMKKVDSAINDPGTGDGWFKIFEDGYDESTGQWCVKKLIDNGGFLTVNLPKGLVGGNYLVRPELLTLHVADQGDPQYYLGCAQVFLKSTGDQVPESTVSIPGHVSKSDKADSFNIWAEPMDLPYPIPGPPVTTFKSGGATTQTSQTEGQRPADCICESGSNFCGVEVPDYNSENGCWDAGQKCWDQLDECYQSAPATGNGACKLWEEKCQGISDACSSGDFNGPPNKGVNLTPLTGGSVSVPGPIGSGTSGSSGNSTSGSTTPDPADGDGPSVPVPEDGSTGTVTDPVSGGESDEEAEDEPGPVDDGEDDEEFEEEPTPVDEEDVEEEDKATEEEEKEEKDPVTGKPRPGRGRGRGRGRDRRRKCFRLRSRHFGRHSGRKMKCFRRKTRPSGVPTPGPKKEASASPAAAAEESPEPSMPVYRRF